MAKEIVVIEWKPRRKVFVESESGLEVKVVNVGVPKSYDVEASDSLPLMLQVDNLIRRPVKGTPANAYCWSSVQTHTDEYRSDYHVTIELYKILKNQRRSK